MRRRLNDRLASPRWHVKQYNYEVSPTLVFQIDVDPDHRWHYACAFIGPLGSAKVLTVDPGKHRPLSLNAYADLCERLAAQMPSVDALLQFFAALAEP